MQVRCRQTEIPWIQHQCYWLPTGSWELERDGKNGVAERSVPKTPHFVMLATQLSIRPQLCNKNTNNVLISVIRWVAMGWRLRENLPSLIKDTVDRPTLAPFAPNKSAVPVTCSSEVGTEAVLGQVGSPVTQWSREKVVPATERDSGLILGGGTYSQILVRPKAHDYHWSPSLLIPVYPGKSVVQSTAAVMATCSHDIVHRSGKTNPQANFLPRYLDFSSAEQCNLITPSVPVSRDDVRKFTKRYYSPNISAMKKG